MNLITLLNKFDYDIQIILMTPTHFCDRNCPGNLNHRISAHRHFVVKHEAELYLQIYSETSLLRI